MADQSSTILTALIAGVAALGGTIGGAYYKGDADQKVAQEAAAGNLKLAQQKFYSDLVIKAVESSKPQERLETLALLAETHLIADAEVREAIRAYASKRQDNPQSIPQIQRSTLTVPPPTGQNDRIYLLAGSVQKATQFDSLQRDLSNAAYRILGAKTLNDSGRPDQPEIRYFNAEDEPGALQLRNFMQERLADPSIVAKQYNDPSARPGYIEIWMGR